MEELETLLKDEEKTKLNRLREFYVKDSLSLFCADVRRLADKELEFLREVLGKELNWEEMKQVRCSRYNERVNYVYDLTTKFVNSQDKTIILQYIPSTEEELDAKIKLFYGGKQ